LNHLSQGIAQMFVLIEPMAVITSNEESEIEFDEGENSTDSCEQEIFENLSQSTESFFSDVKE
jgi:hypothetical protein